MRFFCQGAKASTSERIEAVLTLMQVFVAEDENNADGDDDDEVPLSMRRAKPQDQ